MVRKFDEFMEDVYSQLECNASDEYKSKYIVFSYSREDVDSHVDYFRNCYSLGWSAYIALTQFSYHL